MKNFIVNETREMLRFQKKVILLILKMAAYMLRYGLWFLPWIVFLVFVSRPVISGWKAMTADDLQQSAPAMPAGYTPQTFQAKPKQQPLWDEFQRRIDSGVRTLERVSRKIKRA